MYKRLNNTTSKEKIRHAEYFTNPKSPRQKQYETVRAYSVDKITVKEISKEFGYKVSTVNSLISDFKRGRLDLFPEVKMGPKRRRTPESIQKEIIKLRKENISSFDIYNRMLSEGEVISVKTIERILKDAGFNRLRRRTNKELGKTSKNKFIPKRSGGLDLDKLKPFQIDSPVVGIYFFLPYILESGIIDIVKGCNLPASTNISSIQASLSMLALKLIGNQRLSQMDQYDHEPGLGIFAGLNLLPKSTYMCTYSCRTSESMLYEFQERLIKHFKGIYPDFYNGDYINLDFHSIPHYGDESNMEKLWCGSRGKSMKAANTVFAQDSKSNAILYTRSDILRREESKEIKKFITYWSKVNGSIDETLVFDCKFTKYKVLDELTDDGIKFITLRKRSQKILEKALEYPNNDWTRLNLPIKKRKYKNVLVFEEKVTLKDCKNSFRQIVIKDHGRKNPTFIITNNEKIKLSEILLVYAKRWHIENKISELVSFFNLNALSSPLMIRIHFDILWTFIADTLYHRFAKDLRRFEKSLAPTIFRKFVNMPGKLVYTGDKFYVKIRKRAHTPILMSADKLNRPIQIPWLNNKTIQIIWTP